ncbi:MAG TPA: tyrosine-protein phosphatase [Bryobacteraceae bacterium]|jgi:protein-tyrosine phosphatase
MRTVAALLLAIGRLTLAAGIENAFSEQTGPTTYHLEFQAPADAGSIAIYASSRADRIDSAKPLLTVRSGPADVTVPSSSVRVYFHLKLQSGATRVVSTRHIPLEGAVNFRDLGGYRTSDGHHVKWGIMYRSNNLAQLTAKDYEVIGHLGIRLVCDFRTDGERQRSPTKWQGSREPEFAIESIDTIKLLGADRQTGFLNVYKGMIDEGREQFADVMHRLVRTDAPAMVHCTMGKDRTGVFSAFLLTLLGVSREVVQADFELSNKFLVPDDKFAEMAGAYQRRLNLEKPPERIVILRNSGVDPAWLDIAFQAVVSKYGSFDKYLHEGLGLSDADLASLRRRLLEE